ncbi:MAG: hypothetical protein KAT48_14195 [Bacteroidales bacterium]|nr:hypothetical protein [Bacteroidales bacterium]
MSGVSDMFKKFVCAAEKIGAGRQDKFKHFVCQVLTAGSFRKDKFYGLDVYQQIGVYFVVCGVLMDALLLSKVADWSNVQYYEVSLVETARFISLFIVLGFLYISGTARDVVRFFCGCDHE